MSGTAERTGRRFGVSPSRSVLSLALAAGLAVILTPCSMARAGEIVDHPDKLQFPPLRYQPPTPSDFRHTLKCGATAYIVENRELPTFQVTVLIRAGSMYDPVDKAGLADMAGHVMRNGGVEGMTAGELDERLGFLAGEISVRIDESQGIARLFCLSKDADEGLDLLRRVLHTPVFDQAALERYRTDVLSELAQRNASTADIESREWHFLIYGTHPCTIPLRRTAHTVASITREDLIAFHVAHFFPRNFVLAASGDFSTKEMIKKLNALLAGWPDGQTSLPLLTAEIPAPAPGVYMIKKEGVNQSRIRLGHLGVRRDIPDQYALMVMNDILGGGGFTSRITSRVRSDEGLAYNTGSRFDRPVEYPGTFRAWFQTKHSTAAFGTRLIVDEILRIRSERCEDAVVENSKAGFVSDVVTAFSTPHGIASTFADDDYTGRPDEYWRDYSKNMAAVTADDVLAVAQKYLHPDKLVFLVVGDPEAVMTGSDKHPERFSDLGEITILPLRDPLTLEPE